MEDKGILTHLAEAKHVPAAAKEGFEKEGLKYQTKSQKEAEQVAKALVDAMGIEDAVLAAEAMKFDGDVNSLIFAEALNRLAEEETKATTPEAKIEAAKRFAEVGITYDKMARYGGRFNAAINHFYKKSPLGIVMMENAKRKEDFSEWAKPKDKSWKEFFDEMMKEPEFAQVVKEQIKEGLKKERAESRSKRIEKVRGIFRKAKDQFKGGAAYSTIIPPNIITGALDLMEKLYEAGEAVAEVIQKGIDYISSELGAAPWDKEKFRKEWEEKLKEKAPLTPEELKQKTLDKFRNKLKGLSDKQKEDVIRKSHRKIIDSGGLDYEDFRNIIADVTGRGELTPEEVNQMKGLVDKLNNVEKAGEKARADRTKDSIKAFREAEIQAGNAARELNELFWNKPDITRRLTSIMQLNTLGIPALVNNPIYNIWNQITVRLPIGIINNLIDRLWWVAAKVRGKDFSMQYNTVEQQDEFFKKLGFGAGESIKQLGTGLNRQDYIQKEIYGQQLRPFRSWRDLFRWATGQKRLTTRQIIDKSLQGTVGIPAEIVARVLNIGDKPQRFAAEGAQAAAFARALGLKGIDYDLFIEFPREEAYAQYKKQGMSDAEAGKKADYVRESIIKEGKRSTFQQDNWVSDKLNVIFGGKQSGIGGLAKAVTVSPFIKIPSNAFWSYYNLVNPEVAMLQALYHGNKARLNKHKDDNTSALAAREARYWFAHAVTGIAMRAAIIALVKAGVYRPAPDEDDTKKEREGKGFFEQQGTMNIDKLWAVLMGNDPDKVEGGLTLSNRWFGQWGTVGNTIARKHEDMTPEQREAQTEFWDIAFGGLEVDALRDLEQGVFSNTSALLGALNGNGSYGLQRYGVNTLNMFANIIQPAAFAQISRANLPYYTSQKADTFLGQLKQSMLARNFPFVRKLTGEYPQSKISIWGEPMLREGSQVEKLFGINHVNKDNFAQPIYEDVTKTGDIGFFPPAVLPVLEGQKLNTNQARILETFVGQARKANIAPFINDQAIIEGFNVTYSQLSDEDKKYVLNYLYQKGRDEGVEKFYQEFPELKKSEPPTDYEKQIKKDLFKILSKYK